MLASLEIRLRVAALGMLAALSIANIAVADDTTPPQANQTPKPYPEGINCVWLPVLDSYSVIDDQHIVLEVSRGRAYLLTLVRQCRDLDTSLDIGLDRKGSELCGPGDSVVTDSDRCMIHYLEEVSDYKEAKTIVDARDAAERADRQRGRAN